MLLVKVVQVLFVLDLVGPHLGRLRVERAVIVRFAEQRLDREQDRPHVVQRRPLVLQDVQADGTAEVHVRVEARRQELDVRRRVRVRVGKLEQQFVLLALVHGVLGAADGADPLEEVLALREGRNGLFRRHHQRHQLLLESAE